VPQLLSNSYAQVIIHQAHSIPQLKIIISTNKMVPITTNMTTFNSELPTNI